MATPALTFSQFLSHFRYAFDDDSGVGAGVAFLYDLELPPTFKPENCDKEVGEFLLLSPHDVSDF